MVVGREQGAGSQKIRKKTNLSMGEENVRICIHKSMVLGRIGMSGKVLRFISSNYGPNPTAGRPPKGDNPGAIIIMMLPPPVPLASPLKLNTHQADDSVALYLQLMC